MGFEKSMMSGKVFISKPCSYLAYTLVFFILRLITSKQEPTIRASPLSFAQVATKHHQVYGVTHTIKIIFLQLQPIMRPPCYLVSGVNIQGFHHQSLAVVLDAFFQSLLNFFCSVPIYKLSILEFIFNSFEMSPQQFSSLFEWLGYQCLTIK